MPVQGPGDFVPTQWLRTKGRPERDPQPATRRVEVLDTSPAGAMVLSVRAGGRREWLQMCPDLVPGTGGTPSVVYLWDRWTHGWIEKTGELTVGGRHGNVGDVLSMPGSNPRELLDGGDDTPGPASAGRR